MKFDFCIGNPPYQDNSLGDNETFMPPVYDKFLDAAFEIAETTELIHPARFLFNAGNTPKKWNQKMLADPHFKVLHYEQDAKKVFSNTDIKGGVAITFHSRDKEYGAIGTFTPYDELNDILHKVKNAHGFQSMSSIVVTRTAYRLTERLHRDHPEAKAQLSDGHMYDMSTNIFDRLPQVFFSTKPNDGRKYIQILGRENNERVYKFIREDYVNTVSNLHKYKILLPKAVGTGAFGELLSDPLVCGPGIGSTETFISIGCFDNKVEANNVSKYVKTKFARSLLGVLKTTQDLTPEKWTYVPLQDFTRCSDIDWTASIKNIDKQLYKKYALSKEETGFIETHVKEMV